MAKTLDKKLLTIFKWLIILLPLFIFICLFLYPKILKISAVSASSSGQGDVSITQDALGEESYFDATYYYDDGDVFLSTNLSNEFLMWFSNEEYVFWNNGVFNKLIQKLSLISNGSIVVENMFTYFIASYLDYIVFIEVIFMGLYLFRFFIHFGFELFERKKNL